jgi:hypothetical protein
MRPIAALAACCAVSLGLYAATFMVGVKKPLTLGFVHDAIEVKRAYAVNAPGPKVVVFAGSNGLFSFRCQTMEPILGRPCVNASVTVGIGPKLMYAEARTLMAPGDVVLMPLEYQMYVADPAPDLGYPYIVAYAPARLADLSGGQRVRAVFHFDFSYLLSGLSETAIKAAGFERRFRRDLLTPQGDLSGHTVEQAAPFRAAIDPPPIIQAKDLQGTNAGLAALTSFLEALAADRIRVVGTLPTTLDTVPVPEALKRRLATIYRDAGHDFLFPVGDAQYPIDCLYDSPYHLTETCQIYHSRVVAEALRRFL